LILPKMPFSSNVKGWLDLFSRNKVRLREKIEKDTNLRFPFEKIKIVLSSF